jgi:hypothetical protein
LVPKPCAFRPVLMRPALGLSGAVREVVRTTRPCTGPMRAPSPAARWQQQGRRRPPPPQGAVAPPVRDRQRRAGPTTVPNP